MIGGMTYVRAMCSKLAIAVIGIGLAGFFGTNTGAFTASAGNAALGVGESGGLWGQHDTLQYFARQWSLTQVMKCHAMWFSSLNARRGNHSQHLQVDGNRYSLYPGIYTTLTGCQYHHRRKFTMHTHRSRYFYIVFALSLQRVLSSTVYS